MSNAILTFAVDGEPDEVIVEVRKSNLALFGRYFASNSVTIAPGSYFVAATLPDGDQATAWVEVTAGVRAIARLSAPEPIPQRVVPPMQRIAQRAIRALELESFGSDDTRSEPGLTELRIWVGKLPKLEAVSPVEIALDGGVDRWTVSGRIDGDGTAIAQIVSGGWSINCVLPRDQERRFTLDVSIHGATITLEPHLRNRRAESLLRYTTQQDAASARLVYDAMKAKGMVHGKAEDPVAAMAGAYALLAMNQLDELPESWTSDLCKGNEWLPDAAAIRGEHLARLGRCVEADEIFLLLEQRGLPYVSDGLFYAVDRLSASDDERARHLLRTLRPYARAAATRSAFVIFPALDPRNVDATKVPAGNEPMRLAATPATESTHAR